MAFTYELTTADLEAALEYELRTTHSRVLWIRALWSALGFTVIAYAFLFYQFHHHVAAASVAMLVGLLLFVSYPSVIRDQARKGLRKLYRDASDTMLGTHTLDVSTDGLLFTSPSSTTQLAWSGIQSAVVSPAYLFLYVGPGRAIIIPRSRIDARDWSALAEEGSAALGARWRTVPR